jgi:hypothetical protein
VAESAASGSIPKRLVPGVLRAVDAAVVHATATPVYRYGISFNKLFEYMAAARPIVFACQSAYDPASDVGAGLSVPPDDPDKLAEHCWRLPRPRRRYGRPWVQPVATMLRASTASSALETP